VLALNGGPNVSNAHLAISVGGGLGLVMLLNTWGVIWRVQKRLIAWARTSAEQGVAMPPGSRTLDALELPDGAHFVLAVVPDAVLHGRGEPLSVPEHHRAIIDAGCSHV